MCQDLAAHIEKFNGTLVHRGTPDEKNCPRRIHKRPSLSAILNIHIEILWNLTPYLCSKPGLGIQGFAIHIHKICERNQRELRGKPVNILIILKNWHKSINRRFLFGIFC